MNSHSFVKLVVVVKSESHMNRMIKSAILSICQKLSVKNMFKKYQTHFGQFENILPYVIY